MDNLFWNCRARSQEHHAEQLAAIAAVGDRVVDTVRENSVGAAGVSVAQIREMLPAVIEDAILGMQERGILPQAAPAPPVAAPSPSYGTFTWAAEGKTQSSMHRLPIDYSLPAHDFSVKTAWSLWFGGNEDLNVCPLRHCASTDFYGVKMKSQFSELKNVMKELLTEMGL